jgi:cytoskeletal protein CcmA (bactofilin family)
MFKKRENSAPTVQIAAPAPTERITSVLGSGITCKGHMSGSGGVRIEGAYEGDIALRGMLVIGETGRVTGQQIRANVLIIAGAVRADITAEKVEIRSTGRVWGNVVTAAFATEEGAFLRGQIRMEDEVDIGVSQGPESEPVPPPDEVPEGVDNASEDEASEQE